MATLRQTAKRSFAHKTYRYIIYHSVWNILYMPRQIASIHFDRQTFGSCLGKLSTSTLIPHCRNFFVLQVYQNTKVVLRHPFRNGADVFIRWLANYDFYLMYKFGFDIVFFPSMYAFYFKEKKLSSNRNPVKIILKKRSIKKLTRFKYTRRITILMMISLS